MLTVVRILHTTRTAMPLFSYDQISRLWQLLRIYLCQCKFIFQPIQSVEFNFFYLEIQPKLSITNPYNPLSLMDDTLNCLDRFGCCIHQIIQWTLAQGRSNKMHKTSFKILIYKLLKIGSSADEW